jgi:hypothetical protein
LTTSRLEILDGATWEAFTASPVAVLMLGKSDCPACAGWTEELTAFLESPAASAEPLAHVRFGKVMLDERGLLGFKKASPWLAEVTDLPFNVIYRDGQAVKRWAGGGIERLLNRLKRLAEETAPS